MATTAAACGRACDGGGRAGEACALWPSWLGLFTAACEAGTAEVGRAVPALPATAGRELETVAGLTAGRVAAEAAPAVATAAGRAAALVATGRAAALVATGRAAALVATGRAAALVATAA